VQRYILTERGKWIIAMFVVVLIVLPVIIVIISMVTRNSIQNDQYHGINGLSQTENGSVSTGQPSEAPANSSQTVPNDGLDIQAGVLTFMFTPSVQTSFDENTISLIGELLTSPKNTDDAQIAVVIPQLTDADAMTLTTAVSDAFTAYNVPLSRIVFYVNTPEPNTESHELTIRLQ